MPSRAKRPCAGHCGALVEVGYCPACLARGRSVRQSSHQRGYDARWRAYRVQYLVDHPLCTGYRDSHPDQETPATVVDHIIPHRGNRGLFWDPNNHQPLCKSCHDSKTAREDGGFGHEGR